MSSITKRCLLAYLSLPVGGCHHCPHRAALVGSTFPGRRPAFSRRLLHVPPIPAHTVERWIDLLRRRPVTGVSAFDLQIVTPQSPRPENAAWTIF